MNNAIRMMAVEYEHNGTMLRGHLADDIAITGRRPGVLIFPEWWGVNEFAKAKARKLATLGYVALVADVYGNGRAIDIAHPGDAADRAAELRANVGTWRGRATAALRLLQGHPNVDASNIAVIGYCLESALQLIYSGVDVAAVVVFHSSLPTPTVSEAKAINARVLVCLGEADPFVPEQARRDFRAALESAGVTLSFVTYAGVVHSFTSLDADKVGNPALKYDRDADEDSWRRMMALFDQVFVPSTKPAVCGRKQASSTADDFTDPQLEQTKS